MGKKFSISVDEFLNKMFRAYLILFACYAIFNFSSTFTQIILKPENIFGNSGVAEFLYMFV